MNGSDHGLTLELGAYVAKIQPGSVAAKEGSIAVGDRIVCVSILRIWVQNPLYGMYSPAQYLTVLWQYSLSIVIILASIEPILEKCVHLQI